MDPLTRLAHGARAGDDQALEALVQATYDQVWRLCATLLDTQAADDLAQETFLRAVSALPRFRGESSVRTWLLAIARHVCLDELRARSRRRRRDKASAVVDEATVADPCEDVTTNDLVGRLQPDRRAAFVLTQMFGLSYEETADICECPVGTIRSRVARARADLVAAVHQAEVGVQRRTVRSANECSTGGS